MKQIFLLPFLLFSLTAIAQPGTQSYAVGADLSFLKQSEDKGFTFKENGKSVKGLQLFHDHGYNWIRLRLFHTPTQLPNDLNYTIALAKEAKKKGFKFLLDYHYSDTWADPDKQFLPKAWEGLSHADLVKAVYEYTRTTMIAFRDSLVFPDMVQVGNEISHGMMWPDGKLPENWDNFAALLQAGINGVYAGCGNNRRPEIMIHIDKGGDWIFTKDFFDKINGYGINFDVIGQSYYPWWHGSLLDLRHCLNSAAHEYKKNVYVVEAAYNSKPREYIGKNAPFAESPDGQKEFLEEVNRVVMAVPDGRGAGIFWWEPATSRGTRTFFTETGEALPVMRVFDKFTRR